MFMSSLRDHEEADVEAEGGAAEMSQVLQSEVLRQYEMPRRDAVQS
jgi:hypothetical protein